MIIRSGRVFCGYAKNKVNTIAKPYCRHILVKNVADFEDLTWQISFLFLVVLWYVINAASIISFSSRTSF